MDSNPRSGFGRVHSTATIGGPDTILVCQGQYIASPDHGRSRSRHSLAKNYLVIATLSEGHSLTDDQSDASHKADSRRAVSFVTRP